MVNLDHVERYVSMTTPERNRAIKKELVKKYGKQVKVVGGTGTAYGWISIYIELSIPNHQHEYIEKYGQQVCTLCREGERKEEQEVYKICHEAAKVGGSYIGSYSDDMGGEHDNIMARVTYR